MKKIIIFAAMAAMFSLASCQKDEVVANNEAKVSPVFTASINAGTTKTTVNVTTGKITWENTDEITITDNGGTSAVYEIGSIDGTTGKATFTPKSGQPELGDGPYTATYGSVPSTYQTYSTAAGKLYMTAESNDKDFVFTVRCCLMKLNLSKSGETITNIAVTGTPTGGTTKMTYTMYCPGGVDISSAKDFFIALPAGNYDKIEVYKHDATNGFMVCSLIPSTSIAISANHIKPVNASDSKIDFSECQNLPGLFSISNDGGTTIKQIRFSKGNLYAQKTGDNWTWNFYDEQYKYNSLNSTCDEDGFRTATGDDIEIDLFTWGYDKTSTKTSYSLNPVNTTGITGHDTEGNKQLNSSTDGDDWGVAYCESNNIIVGTWRTISTAEWQYLFNTRSNASILFKPGVTVCGKNNCVVLLPDDWQWDSSTVGTDWQKNASDIIEYSEETDINWSTMQEAGAVCLPAAGFRDGSDVVNVGGFGNYWSSTAFDSNIAYRVVFDSDDVFPGNNDDRRYGYSVRLVTESK